jgi:Zn-finger nucleic acid-binding protein
VTPEAQSLHCPNCGAAAEPDAGRCPYCRARLATVSCPSCFARLFDGAAFCPSCGARRARAAADGAALTCPSCKGPLAAVEVGGTPLYECGTCDGTWLDAATFEAVCASRESQAAVLHRYAARPVVAGDARVRYRPCLRCGKMMNRVNFGRLSGTIVDVCRGHGTFLDAGELHAIMSFIQAGGLDRARSREIEDLKEERQRLERAQAAQARRSRDHDAGNRWASSRWTAGDVFTLLDSLKPD